jgi:transcriptional regulator with XRE-family HTH domain
MDMKIDTQKLIQLRNTKAWSQQHLAEVSGLSLRTIQRIEKTQSASQESVKAIAAAFDGTPEMLLVEAPANKEQLDAASASVVQTRRAGFSLSRQQLLWIATALLLSFTLAVYWSQSVNANDGNKKEVGSGAPVQVGDMALQQGMNWLQLVDDEQYALSWDESGPIFKTSVTQTKWIEAMQLVRQPLGIVKSRELAMAQAPTTLPGLPEGDYLIITFSTAFDGNTSVSTETLSMVKVNDEYRAIGYFIR